MKIASSGHLEIMPHQQETEEVMRSKIEAEVHIS